MKVEKDDHQKKLEKFQKGLEEDWRVMVLGKSADQKKDLLKEIAIDNVQLKAAQDMDVDLAQKKEAAKAANSSYAEGFKINKLKLEFIVSCLQSDGVTGIPEPEVFLSAAAKKAMKE